MTLVEGWEIKEEGYCDRKQKCEFDMEKESERWET